MSQIIGQRVHDLVETGEADVGLVLHPTAMDHPDTGRGGYVRSREKQCRLAHPRLARQQKRRTPNSGSPEKRIKDPEFAVATSRGDWARH